MSVRFRIVVLGWLLLLFVVVVWALIDFFHTSGLLKTSRQKRVQHAIEADVKDSSFLLQVRSGKGSYVSFTARVAFLCS